MSRRVRSSASQTTTVRPRAGKGKALDPAARAALEPRFGHDFGNVRVHADAAAAASAAALNARAFTIGDDIAFAADAYAPHSAAGQALIAHELAHVMQQSRGDDRARDRDGDGRDAEQRADAAAARAIAGHDVSPAALGGASAGMQAKPDDPPVPSPDAEPDVITGADGDPPAADKTVLDGFANDKADLTAKHQLLIDALAFQVWSNLDRESDATVSISITGHTDTTGTEKHNSGLGGERAANAKAALEAALAKQGVGAAKLEGISATSQGESALAVPTADEVAEPRNRRVEVEVTFKMKVKPPPPKEPSKPLPGTPGGPKIWEVPGVLEGLGEPDPYGPKPAPKAPPTREWLENALKRDPLLKKLPEWARDKAIGALKDADEKAAEAIIDAIPFDDEYKKAAKAAMKALLQTLKGRKFKPPPEPPRGIPEDMLKTPSFPKMPGEMIFKLPPIRF
jgi:outer membrane protein OmpA-like peptidoglycan-associated protein